MNSQFKYFCTLISNRYTQLELQFLTVWVIALAVWPDFILSNLQTFFTVTVGYTSARSAAYVNAQNAFTALFGIVGAMVLDGYLTHYGMIFFSSLFYSAGLILLYVALGGGISVLFPVGLFLIAVGKSSLMSSANGLSGEQAPTSLIEYFFKFTILTITFLFVSSEEMVDWSNQFLVAFIVMGVVAVVPLFYNNFKAKSFRKPIGERQYPLKRVLHVYIAAFMKRRLPLPHDPHMLNKGTPEHPLEPTNGKRFLEKAAIVQTSRPREERKKWLCTVTEVEESKRLLHMVPICMAFLPYGLVKSIGDTFFLEQSDQMDTTIGDDGMEIPVQAFIILAKLSRLATKGLYKVFIWKRLKGSGKTYAPAIEFAMGMVLSTLCCAVASWIAMETFDRSSKLSVFWLIPQFVIFGAMDGLAGEGIEGFFSGDLPHSMTHYDTVFAEGIVGMGTFFAIVLVLVTDAATPWFSEEDTRFDRFYHLLTVVGTSIFIGYCYAAVRYYHQGHQETQVEDETRQKEEAIHETRQKMKLDRKRRQKDRKQLSSLVAVLDAIEPMATSAIEMLDMEAPSGEDRHEEQSGQKQSGSLNGHH